MLKNVNKNIKASKYLNLLESANLATIVGEVKQHGFYSAFCTDVISNAHSHAEMMRMIKAMALNAHLKVSFNMAENVCIFEALID